MNVERLRGLVSGGVTPEYKPDEHMLRAVENLDMRRLRLINVDYRSLRNVLPDGAMDIQFVPHLREGLRYCRQLGSVPHIVLGQFLPEPLALAARDGRMYGPSSWEDYRRFVRRFIEFVALEEGFTETEWEVGNEMNWAGNNWASPVKPDDIYDPDSFGAYMELYRAVAETVAEFRREHPGHVLRVGGPAVTPMGFQQADPQRNWVLRFLDRIAEDGIPCDFVSMHIYGNLGSGQEVLSSLERIRERARRLGLSTAFSVSEWGASDKNVPLTPLAGSYSLELLSLLDRAGIDDAIFLAVNDFPRFDWPVLFYDGAPTHYLHAFKFLSSLKGTGLTIRTNREAFGSLAVLSPDGQVRVALWNLSWWPHRLDMARPAGDTAPDEIEVRIELPAKMAGLAVVSAARHGVTDAGAAKRVKVRAEGASAVLKVDRAVLDPGDYLFLDLAPSGKE